MSRSPRAYDAWPHRITPPGARLVPGLVPATSSKLHAVASLVVLGFLGEEQAELVMAEHRRRLANAVTC
jgi:hypothetical protein